MRLLSIFIIVFIVADVFAHEGCQQLGKKHETCWWYGTDEYVFSTDEKNVALGKIIKIFEKQSQSCQEIALAFWCSVMVPVCNVGYFDEPRARVPCKEVCKEFEKDCDMSVFTSWTPEFCDKHPNCLKTRQ